MTEKKYIHKCKVNRLCYQTESPKEDFDEFKTQLLNLCDGWVESQRLKLDERFSKL